MTALSHALRLDAAECDYRAACRALVAATRDEVASSGHLRQHLSRVVERFAADAQDRWRDVLAIAAEDE